MTMLLFWRGFRFMILLFSFINSRFLDGKNKQTKNKIQPTWIGQTYRTDEMQTGPTHWRWPGMSQNHLIYTSISGLLEFRCSQNNRAIKKRPVGASAGRILGSRRVWWSNYYSWSQKSSIFQLHHAHLADSSPKRWMCPIPISFK